MRVKKQPQQSKKSWFVLLLSLFGARAIIKKMGLDK